MALFNLAVVMTILVLVGLVVTPHGDLIVILVIVLDSVAVVMKGLDSLEIVGKILAIVDSVVVVAADDVLMVDPPTRRMLDEILMTTVLVLLEAATAVTTKTMKLLVRPLTKHSRTLKLDQVIPTRLGVC